LRVVRSTLRDASGGGGAFRDVVSWWRARARGNAGSKGTGRRGDARCKCSSHSRPSRSD
jgi:hypothetical protein